MGSSTNVPVWSAGLWFKARLLMYAAASQPLARASGFYGFHIHREPAVARAESVGINRHGVVGERTTRGRASHPPRPRVMRRVLVTGWRSVDRGSVSRAIELRKKQLPCGGVIARCVVHTAPAQRASGGEARRSHWNPSERGRSRDENRENPRVSVRDSGRTGRRRRAAIPAGTIVGSRTDP